MRYALLIYGDESAMPPSDLSASDDVYQRHASFTSDITDAGIGLGGAVIHRTGSATTVRVRDDRRWLTDGPFGAAVEQLEGFHIIDVDDLDAAIEVAARAPGALLGSIEIRPIAEWA